LIVNGPDGHVIGGWNRAIDSHLSGVLVELEGQLSAQLQRPIAYTVCDSEGGGLPLGERYIAANQAYLSYLCRQGYLLDDFELLTEWQAVSDDPQREVVQARWLEPAKAEAEVRDLVLMRRLGERDPSRIYTGKLPTDLALSEVPGAYRQRWSCQERVIREAVNGANLNANFGYSYQQVPNRTIQRQWQQAQEQVEVSQRSMARHSQAVRNLQGQLVSLRQAYQQQQGAFQHELAAWQSDFLARQLNGQPWRRCQQRLARTFRHWDQANGRYQRRRHKMLAQLRQHRAKLSQTGLQLSQRQQVRDGLDTASLCRERHLEKDQIMLNLQLLLTNLHHWARHHYFDPQWQQLELKTATALIYRKSGWVDWGAETIEVLLEPYRYPEHQQAMAESCRRFNAANLRWRDGRLLRIQVAPP
jgi:hypothetical protein